MLNIRQTHLYQKCHHVWALFLKILMKAIVIIFCTATWPDLLYTFWFQISSFDLKKIFTLNWLILRHDILMVAWLKTSQKKKKNWTGGLSNRPTNNHLVFASCLTDRTTALILPEMLKTRWFAGSAPGLWPPAVHSSRGPAVHYNRAVITPTLPARFLVPPRLSALRFQPSRHVIVPALLTLSLPASHNLCPSITASHM